ncbi:MAG: hypothetical protein FJX20_13030 [Alphaproteobacteria bacterium]|nr:hypothetical protein [Alphaproteobacteria bacterium]
MASVYGFPQGSSGYDIVDDMTMPYWKPALRDLGHSVVHPYQSGYKFHVSVQSRDAEKVAKAVLPVLQRANLDHKVVYPLSAYEDMCKGAQAGKFITIYIGPLVTAYAELKRQLDPVFAQLTQAGVSPGPTPQDRQKGHSVAENKAGSSGFLWYITTNSYFK